MNLHFTYPEDARYFADILTAGDIEKLERDYGQLFDFRDPKIKLAEFSSRYNHLKQAVIKRDGETCSLKLLPECQGGWVIDHVIPRSSNVLNKTLRHLGHEPGKKVPAQSFGSNHIDNLVLACKACNGEKFNHLPTNTCSWLALVRTRSHR
jgi:5-methylcytosine-specific restriction endonuclease McrA